MTIAMTIKLTPSETPKFGTRNLTSDHVWIDLGHSSNRLDQVTPALFLDRDGVIVVDNHYMNDPDQVELMPGVCQLIKAANSANIPVIVVTNQSGIGRGYFGWEELEAVQDRIENLLSEQNAQWDAVLACPHHRDAEPPYQNIDHPYRKPNPGMLLAAQEILNIDLARSWIIGDKAGDLEAGKRAGLAGGVHVATHPDSAENEREKAVLLETASFFTVPRPNMIDVWDHLIY